MLNTLEHTTLETPTATPLETLLEPPARNDFVEAASLAEWRDHPRWSFDP